jgi:hypothetical protein
MDVMEKVMLLKKKKEKEDECISIWKRIIKKLVENVCNNNKKFEVENEDMNVENDKMMMLLFNELKIMKKK